MVESLINTRTGGAPSPTDANLASVRASESTNAAHANAFTTPAPHIQAAPLTRSVVSPDALIAAQQQQDTSRARMFDARRAYGEAQSDHRPPSPQTNANAPQNSAEIIDLFTQSARSARAAQDDGLTFEAVKTAASAQDRGASLSASRAYVNAGGHDGRVFGADTSGGGRLHAGSLGVNIVI